MKTEIYHRLDCSNAKGLCVIIDVLRAFTTAAVAFDRGAKEIVLVSTKEEAFQKLEEDPSLILMGEIEGDPIPGFHFGNSPMEIKSVHLKGKKMVQRTSSGTQGAVVCKHASQMLLSSFVVAEATLKRITEIQPSHVSFIVTGRNNGDEDLALAEYLQERLMKKKPNVKPFLDRVLHSPCAKRMLDEKPYPLNREDLELATHLDFYPFAMEVTNTDKGLIANSYNF